jgi:hypothetical protein
MHAVGDTQSVSVVVVRAAPDGVLALVRNGVGPREALLVRPPQLVLGRHDLGAAAGSTVGGSRAAVGVRVVFVLLPLPHVARQIVVTVRPAPGGVRSHVLGARGGEDRAVVRRLVVAPRVATVVGVARRLLELRLAREPLASPRAVGRGIVPRDAGHGLAGAVEVRVLRADRFALRTADLGRDALAPGRVGDLGPVEEEGREVHRVRRMLVLLAAAVGAHGERTARDQEHIGWGGSGGRRGEGRGGRGQWCRRGRGRDRGRGRG